MGKSKTNYLCSGFIICLNCGKKVYAVGKRYVCYSFHRQGECVGSAMHREKVDNLVSERVSALVQERILSNRDKYLKNIAERLGSGADGVAEEISGYETRLKEIDRKISNWIECISPENKDLVNEKLSVLKLEKKGVEEKLVNLKQSRPPEEPEQEAEKILEQVEEFYKVFIDGNIKQRREVMRAFIEKILFDPAGFILRIFLFRFPKCSGTGSRTVLFWKSACQGNSVVEERYNARSLERIG